MRRLTDYSYCAVIEAGLRTMPAWIRPLFRDVHYFCGADPVFAGITREFVDEPERRSYRNTAHAKYARWSPDGVPTVVLPANELPCVIVHELGHILDEMLGFRFDPVYAVIDYAKRNRAERFACWFHEWAWSDTFGAYLNDQEVFGRMVTGDKQMQAVMRDLERGMMA